MFGVWNAWTHPWSRSRRTRSCRSRRTSAWDSVCRSRTPGLPWDVCHWCGCRVRFPAKYWGTGRIYNKMEMTKCKKKLIWRSWNSSAQISNPFNKIWYYLFDWPKLFYVAAEHWTSICSFSHWWESGWVWWTAARERTVQLGSVCVS